MTDLRSRLNIHGIVDLDQMALVLTSLVEQVDRQNKSISDLKESLSYYVTKESFYEKLTKLEGDLSSARTKIDAIHEAATATAMDKRISAGNLASSNFKHICNLSALVMECATKIELEAQQQELSAVQFNVTELRRDYDKSLSILDGLSQSQHHQSSRIGSLESAVAGKIDRSECDHLQSLVAKVLLYDAFKSDTTNDLKRLNEFRVHSLGKHDDYDSHLSSIDAELVQVNGSLGRTASKKDAHQLARELQALEEKLLDYARVDALNEVRSKSEQTSSGLAICSDEVKALQDTAAEMRSDLNTKATIQSLRQCVLRRHYEQAIAALGSELEQKAAHSLAKQLERKLQEAEARALVDRERLQVAMRFVEWFTSRGENYEHNIQVIDKHLKGLIVSPSCAQGSGGAAAVNVLGVGGVTTAGASSSVHSYYLPGNRVAFHANHDHAP